MRQETAAYFAIISNGGSCLYEINLRYMKNLSYAIAFITYIWYKQINFFIIVKNFFAG